MILKPDLFYINYLHKTLFCRHQELQRNGHLDLAPIALNNS
jgi:hypothetical protein